MRVKDNYVLKGISGRIGDEIYKTNKFGKTYSSTPPDVSNVAPTKAQNKTRNDFAKAVAFAKSMLDDPAKVELYKSGDNKSVYVKALKDYFQQQKGNRRRTDDLIIDDDLILKHHLTYRQVKALRYIKKRGKITNSDYRLLNHISKPSATRDLQDLTKKGILKPSGIRGAGAFYEIMGSET
jgi:Fic family protein